MCPIIEINDILIESNLFIPHILCIIQDLMITKPYINKNSEITEQMRTILVDWLIEVQENFALFHETLYLAVQIMDHYLERKPVKREYLQLVGATSMLIASKFEVSIINIIIL